MDISDIERAIVAGLGQAVIGPDFLPGAFAASTVIDSWPEIRMFRGWPVPTALNNDLAANIANVSVFPVPGMTRLLPTTQRQWRQAVQAVPTIILTLSGNVVTISGSTGPGQVCGVALGQSGSKLTGYAHRVTSADTLASVASSLAGIIPGAVATGATITLPVAPLMQVGAVADQTSYMELRRQTQDVMLTVWCAHPQDRDAIASAVDIAMMGLDRLVIDGTSTGPITYRSSKTIDEHETAALWRRDLTYTIEYPTTQTQVQPSILFPFFTVSTSSTGANPFAILGPRYPGL